MRAFGLLALLISAPALAQTASPVPTSMPEDDAPPKEDTFDADAAKKVLTGVEYRDCGKGGPGKLLVTFAPDGTVERVVLAEGSWQAAVAVCVTRRFAMIGVPKFTGSAHTVKWSVNLEGAPEAAPAPTFTTSPSPYPYPYAPPPPPPGGGVIPATDGPPPPGYHVEDRRRSGLLITGSIISGFGLLFLAIGMSDERRSSGSSEDTMKLAGIVHLAIGIPLFCVGLASRRVFVPNTTVSIAPTLHRGGGSAALTFTF